MKSAMLKSTLREIKGSFGRWFAILAIVALGVGFFSGLKVCKDAFTKTGDEYLSAHSFFDFQLFSTLGLESEDVETIAAVDGVKYAEGSYSADVLISKGEDNADATGEDAEESGADDQSGELISKFHTLSDNINTPSLKAGEMPTEGNQCLADAQRFTAEDIGSTITISSGNSEDTADMLAYDTYTITSIADYPLYLNFERGTASIGDGTADCLCRHLFNSLFFGNYRGNFFISHKIAVRNILKNCPNLQLELGTSKVQRNFYVRSLPFKILIKPYFCFFYGIVFFFFMKRIKIFCKIFLPVKP